VLEALGIVRGTEGKASTLEHIVQLYCERERFRLMNFHDYVERMDKLLLMGVKSKETIDNLWGTVRDVIIERLTRKPRRKRPALA
jgi:hypothetical protein